MVLKDSSYEMKGGDVYKDPTGRFKCYFSDDFVSLFPSLSLYVCVLVREREG